MIVWRDRETGPAHPSIGSAPSTGTFGMSLSVTTFMMALLRLADIQRVRQTISGQARLLQSAARLTRRGLTHRDQEPHAVNRPGCGNVADRLIPEQQAPSFF